MNRLSNKDKIIFYDSECGFCNSSVQFILKNKTKDFYFVSLHSDLAMKYFKSNGIILDYSTLYFVDKNQIYDQSTAVLKIMKNLKFRYKLLSKFLFIIPTTLRDYVYQKIAKNRHRIKPQNCIILTQTEKEFFIE